MIIDGFGGFAGDDERDGLGVANLDLPLLLMIFITGRYSRCHWQSHRVGERQSRSMKLECQMAINGRYSLGQGRGRLWLRDHMKTVSL